jgi:hypothetical protein
MVPGLFNAVVIAKPSHNSSFAKIQHHLNARSTTNFHGLFRQRNNIIGEISDAFVTRRKELHNLKLVKLARIILKGVNFILLHISAVRPNLLGKFVRSENQWMVDRIPIEPNLLVDMGAPLFTLVFALLVMAVMFAMVLMMVFMMLVVTVVLVMLFRVLG